MASGPIDYEMCHEAAQDLPDGSAVCLVCQRVLRQPKGALEHLGWIFDESVRRALAQAVEQEGWFDEHFLTRVLARLDGAGYRLVPSGGAS